MKRIQKKEPKPRTVLREIIEWGVTILTGIALALIIKSFVLEVVLVDKKSMLETIHPGDELISLKITYELREPRRGEIVTFEVPGEEDEIYIKRVIGIPGDTVEIHDENVYVNGEQLVEPYLTEPTYGTYSGVVPEGHIFVMGDNRNDSKDSRDSSLSFIPIENVISRAVFRIYPFSDFGVVK